jgi:hypothetical protein
VQKDGDGSWGRYGLWLAENVVYFNLYKDGGGQSGLTATDKLVVNAWNHIAAVYDGDYMQLIVNGESTGQLAFSGQVSTSNLSLYIAADPTEGAGLYLPGEIDEIRIWNKARSIDAIRSTMYDTLSAVYYQNSDSGLVAYYRFDEIEDLGVNSDGTDDIRDLTIHQNHGDIYGNPTLVHSDAMTTINEQGPQIPETNQLAQNFPNPFNSSTRISFTLSRSEYVQLAIYNALGQKIETLVEGMRSQGIHEISFIAKNYPSGIYLYRIQAGSFSDVRKMIIVR